MDKISIKTKLTEKDYIRFNLYQYYKSWQIKLLTIFGLVLLAGLLIFYLSGLTNFDYIFSLSFGVTITVLVPLMMIFNSKKNFKLNTQLQEEITYEFVNDLLLITGESFNAQLATDKLFKLSFSKKWFLIYPSPQIVNIIPIHNINVEQINYLKTKYPSILK